MVMNSNDSLDHDHRIEFRAIRVFRFGLRQDENRVAESIVNAKNSGREPRVKRSFVRRYLVPFLGLIFLVVGCWELGLFGLLLNRAISRSLEQHDYERADDLTAFAARFGMETPETLFLKARLRRKQLRTAEVPDLLMAAGKAGFDRTRILHEYIILEAQSGKIRSVAGELNSLLQQNSEDGAEICAAYVNGALMAGDLEVAMTILPVWKEEYPADPEPNYANARILEYQHDVNGAISELQLANEKASRFWPSRYALGRILYGENRIEESLVQLRIASEMRANAAPLLQQAKCLRSLSRLDEAHQILLSLAQMDKSAIRESFALVCEPEQGLPIEYELGTLEAAMGMHESAIRWLDQVLLATPNDLDARYSRAISLQQTGKTTEAEHELSEVSRIRTLLLEVDRLVDEINRSPNDPHLESRCRIGELFIQYENARHGVFWLQEALNRDPNYHPAHAILADYYTKLATKQADYAKLAEFHRQAAVR